MKPPLILLLILSAIWSQTPTHTPTLFDRYLQSKTRHYQPLTPTEYQQAIGLFSSLLKEANLTTTQQHQLTALGLEIRYHTPHLISIQSHASQGQGIFLIRYTPTAHRMLSLPHRFFDRHTGYIGYKLMRHHPYRAAAFNTLHRKVMDSAHTTQTLFNAFHIAFAKAFPKEAIYQLHGFDNHTIPTIDAIVSTTTPHPSTHTLAIAQCFQSIGIPSRLYGTQIQRLGGTTNHQAHTLHRYGYQHFVHIEMSRPLRESLKRTSSSRDALSACLP